MIKFGKWMYELGYNAARKDMLSAVDGIPNDEPKESDFKDSRNEQVFERKMRTASIIYDERKNFKQFVHQKFDPNYEPEIDIDKFRDIL